MKTLCVIKRVFDVVFVVFLVFVSVELVLITDAVINDETPAVFGYTIYRMKSSSMEPTLSENDVILSKIVTDEKQIKNGDIVTIKRKNDRDSVTHTVVKAPYKNHGHFMIQTKGVANKEPDAPVYVKYVKAKYVKTLSFFDSFYSVLLSPFGIVLFLFLVIYMIFDEIFVRHKAKRVRIGNEHT